MNAPSPPGPRVRLAVALAVIAAGPGTASALQQHHRPSLGAVDFPASCSDTVRATLNEGVALLHHMTYPQSRAAFEEAARLDPRCTMAHWGIAMTLFTPAWPNRPSVEERRRGWREVQAAMALRPPTARESLYVAAAAAFFLDPDADDYWARIRRWDQAMGRLHAAHPQDPDATALYALAYLVASPSPDSTAARAAVAAGLALGVLARHPDHPGAMHYLIHANDVTGRERESPDVVRRYEAIAPDNPHALHMPTHIYTRLGDWEGVIRGNVGAARAALAHPAGDHGEYVWDEYPHAVEYLVYAYLQTGHDAEADSLVTLLGSMPRLEPTFKTAFHLASTPARLALERRAWSEAARLEPRVPAGFAWDRWPWPEGVVWFARGLGACHEGRPADSRRARDRLVALEATARDRGEPLFAANIRILRLEVDGCMAREDGDAARAVTLLRDAAALEASTPKHPVTPAPTLPAAELLGDLLLAQHETAAALDAYRQSLHLYPRRFRSLLGAARAARGVGDADAARHYYGQLLESAAGTTRGAILQEARAFLTNGR